jgi:hypothetical protein
MPLAAVATIKTPSFEIRSAAGRLELIEVVCSRAAARPSSRGRSRCAPRWTTRPCDRLTEAAKRLAERVDELRAVEKDWAQRAEHNRVSAERDRLAQEMGSMAEPIVRIAHLVTEIEACDREIGRVNATSALGFGYIRPVLSGSAPVIAVLFQEALVWDAFNAVAGLPSKAA